MFKEKLYTLVKNAIKILPAQYASVDIAEEVNRTLRIMEINSGIVVSKFIEQIPGGYQIAKPIYQKAILDFIGRNKDS